MRYQNTLRRLRDGGIILLDGGTGTELERRGVTMDPGAWCGPTTLANVELLETIHGEYIAAGADVITANTFASSRLMLQNAGFQDQFEEINRTAIRAAKRARDRCGRDDVLVAGSLSHINPVSPGMDSTDLSRVATGPEMRAAFGELADLIKDEGCDLILLEMMYHHDRMPHSFAAAAATGMPIWAGFSAKRGPDGSVMAFTRDSDVPFSETVSILNEYKVDAAGIMHTPANIIGDALTVLREAFDGPLTAYPDSGYFKMPHWQFDAVIPPADLVDYARGWVDQGAQVLGGCCGLSPEHIAALAPFKTASQPHAGLHSGGPGASGSYQPGQTG